MHVTIAAVATQMLAYGVLRGERETLQSLLVMTAPLPDPLTIAAVRTLLGGQNITLPDVLLRQFRDHALYLTLAADHIK